jgi:hypothetical protein
MALQTSMQSIRFVRGESFGYAQGNLVEGCIRRNFNLHIPKWIANAWEMPFVTGKEEI